MKWSYAPVDGPVATDIVNSADGTAYEGDRIRTLSVSDDPTGYAVVSWDGAEPHTWETWVWNGNGNGGEWNYLTEFDTAGAAKAKAEEHLAGASAPVDWSDAEIKPEPEPQAQKPPEPKATKPKPEKSEPEVDVAEAEKNASQVRWKGRYYGNPPMSVPRSYVKHIGFDETRKDPVAI